MVSDSNPRTSFNLADCHTHTPPCPSRSSCHSTSDSMLVTTTIIVDSHRSASSDGCWRSTCRPRLEDGSNVVDARRQGRHRTQRTDAYQQYPGHMVVTAKIVSDHVRLWSPWSRVGARLQPADQLRPGQPADHSTPSCKPSLTPAASRTLACCSHIKVGWGRVVTWRWRGERLQPADQLQPGRLPHPHATLPKPIVMPFNI